MVFSQKASKNTLDRLLMGNQKTIELYDQYLPKSPSDPKVWELVKIRDEHKKEAALLKRLLQELGERVEKEKEKEKGGQPEELRGNEKLKSTYIIDDHGLLSRFIEREMAQIKECERALDKKEQLSEGIKHTIQTLIIPKLKLHIDLLEQLIEQSTHKKIG